MCRYAKNLLSVTPEGSNVVKDSIGSIQEKIITKIDKQGRIIKISKQDSKEYDEFETSIYKYDNQDRKIEKLKYDIYDSLIVKTIYEYDVKGYLVKKYFVDSKGNPWCTGYFGSYIINVDAQSGEARFWSTPTPSAMPRRNKMDGQDRYWFAQYTADKVGMFDTRTEKFQEWSLPHKYTTPYATSEPDKYGRVYASSNMTERLARIDTETGEVVEYLMPGNFDSKKIWVDPFLPHLSSYALLPVVSITLFTSTSQ